MHITFMCEADGNYFSFAAICWNKKTKQKNLPQSRARLMASSHYLHPLGNAIISINLFSVWNKYVDAADGRTKVPKVAKSKTTHNNTRIFNGEKKQSSQKKE